MTTPATIHQIVRVDVELGRPARFHALCGYVSTDKREFRKEKQGLEKLTCAPCIVRTRPAWQRNARASVVKE